jgi:uncharacterized BrkB/YihY/UPF0761 family membrane protein
VPAGTLIEVNEYRDATGAKSHRLPFSHTRRSTVEFLSIFALFVLIILAAAAVALWVWLAIWPGRIAKERGHRQAEAVRVMGYWGAITLGILMPIAFVWAYWDYGDDKIRARGEATR